MICRVVLLLLFLTGTRALLVKSIPIGETEELKNTASKAAGVFRSSVARSARPELKNVIVVTAANVAYSHHLQNFCCWMNRLGFHALMFSLDPEMHAYALDMASRDEDGSKEGPLIHSYLWGTNIKKTAEWRSPAFHVITTAKLEVVLSLLRLHYDVLFVDTDVALIRDPFPYLMWKNVDMAYSVNQICPHSDTFDVFKALYVDEGNTGFYFMRSTNSTIRLYELTIIEAPLFPTTDEQTIFWTLVKDDLRMQGKGAPDVVDLGYCHNFEYSGNVRSRRRAGEVNVTIPYLDVKSPKFKTATSADLRNNGPFVKYTKNNTNGEIVICPLDGCLFSVGALVDRRNKDLHTKGLQMRGESAVSVHANWIIGKQKKHMALRQYGFWLAKPTVVRNATHGNTNVWSCNPYMGGGN
jgi:hypothetical protein